MERISPEFRPSLNRPRLTYFSSRQFLIPLSLLVGSLGGAWIQAHITGQPFLSPARASADAPRVDTAPLKPIVRAHHIQSNLNYCNDTVTESRQSQPAETGCATPTPIEAPRINKPSEANNATNWYHHNDNLLAESMVTVTLTPTLTVEVPAHAISTPPPLPAHLICENFSLDDEWAHECRRIRGY